MAAVVHLSRSQVARIEEADTSTFSIYGGTDVLFLEDSVDNVSPTFKAGRRGKSMGTARRYYNQSGTTWAHVDRVALVRPPVSEGDTVIVVGGEYAGIEGEVSLYDSTNGRVTIRTSPESRSSYYYAPNTLVTGAWVKVGGAPRSAEVVDPDAGVSEEDKQLSDWWIKRIKTAAATAKKQHGMCSAIDTVVKRLLEPVAKKWSVVEAEVQASDDVVLAGFWVVGPDGKKASFFTDRAEADKDVAARNKKELDLI